jgi:tetratricopeptide (TPR) repeat protein
MRLITSFIFLFLFFYQGGLNAQGSKFDSVVVAGIEQIYNIKFEKAEKTFRGLIADYPKHPAGRFFLAMIDWWKIRLNSGNEDYDDNFYQKLEDVIYFCEEILDDDPENVDALFFLGGSIGFRGRLRIMRESWLSAADDGREALPVVEEAALLDPDNLDVQLGFGIYNYYAEVIPDEYPLVKPLMVFFPSGDKKLGIKQLKSTAMNGLYAKHEARYFLMTLYYNFEKDWESAQHYSEMLTRSFPNNPVFERWRGRIAVKKGDWIKANSIFKNVLVKAKKNLTGYNKLMVKREAAYYVANNYKITAQLDSALVYFNRCIIYSNRIPSEEESGFLINSTLYIGAIKDMNGEYDEAIKYYNEVLEMREFGNSHSLAESYLDRLDKRKIK